ncbi:alpha-L-fucosidase [Paenibacillus marchantiophytorum]|uniref:alpha-L-fucosidase n=1 Tax=Paenibacillus marchantiophytorum TaxID=1619310 RepID=A0ABQ2BR83_9BACL|nr:alpha-L-fucosidase [Paenibacillus marchantiophytorum]GGI44795.1 alpha-L-fucosidase [Paenibacillus marchantiophytorum]
MFKPTFESLYQYESPEWFRDAKFGIWSHWGPQSVPMFGDWYARYMYEQGTAQYNYHLRHYGHPSKFGYKDICKLWKAENFDPEGLMELYYKAGARYFVALATHHDNFFNYDSKVNRFNSTQIGPMKDICRLWQTAAKKYNLPFGLTEHLGASFSWWKTNKGSDNYGPYKGLPYDGNDPDYADFYYNNYEHAQDRIDTIGPWYTLNENFHQYWVDAIKEMIDEFQPDLLYSDGVLPFGSHHNSWEHEQGYRDVVSPGDPSYRPGLEVLAYHYNKSIEKNGSNQAVYLQKDKRPEIYNVGILDIEKSQMPRVTEKPWHTDTCIGNWFYDAKQTYKKTDQILEMLVDIVSKNGNMLLNILQRPDGTIDEEAKYLLDELAKWFVVCGEGIYGTRPWKVSGEGNTLVKIVPYVEEKTSWNSSDYRFTSKGNHVYSFIMCPPANGVCVLKSFNDETVKSVQILGGGKLEFTQDSGVLAVKLPQELPATYFNCLKTELE